MIRIFEFFVSKLKQQVVMQGAMRNDARREQLNEKFLSIKYLLSSFFGPRRK